MSNNAVLTSPPGSAPRANQPRPKPRLSIATQIYLLVLGFALALLLTSLLAWNDAGHQALVRSQTEIDEGLQVVQSDFERESLDSLSLMGFKHLSDRTVEFQHKASSWFEDELMRVKKA